MGLDAHLGTDAAAAAISSGSGLGGVRFLLAISIRPFTRLFGGLLVGERKKLVY